MNNLSEYRSELDALHFSPDEIDAIARRAAEGAAQAKKPRRRFPRAVLIAAALTAALAVGAGAAGVLPSPAEVFSPIFGGSAAQTEIIDKIGYPVDAGDSDSGITITADAVMGDAYNAAVVFTFRTDDGSPILPDGISAESLLVRGGGASANILGGSHGSAWFVDEVPGDDAVQMVQTISADRSLIGATADAEFDGLYRWDDSAGEAVALAEGNWKFRFTLGYEDTSVTLGGGETFTQDGMTFTIDAITLSPVAFKVDYTVASEVVWSNSGSGQQSDADHLQMQRYLENVEILLTKTDGTVVDLSLAGGSISPEDGVTVCSKSNVFSQILPMEELAGISVGGVYFPVPRRKPCGRLTGGGVTCYDTREFISGGTLMDPTKRTIRKIDRDAQYFVAQALGHSSLSLSDYDMIHTVNHNPGITQEELRKKYSQDKSTIARRAAKLEKEGYIVRRPHPVDSRRKQLYITEKGAMLRDAKVEAESFFFQWLTEDLSEEELGQLCPLLERIQLRSRTERRAQFETLLARYQKTHPVSGSDQ